MDLSEVISEWLKSCSWDANGLSFEVEQVLSFMSHYRQQQQWSCGKGFGVQTFPREWSTGPIFWIIEYKRDEITIESRDKIVIHISLDRDTPMRILIDFAIWSDFVIRHDFTHRKGISISRIESFSRIRINNLKSPMLSKQAVFDTG